MNPISNKPTLDNLGLFEDGTLSGRVHPGPARDWHGTPWEWHQRFMLYLDALELERRVADLASVVDEYDETTEYIKRLIWFYKNHGPNPASRIPPAIQKEEM